MAKFSKTTSIVLALMLTSACAVTGGQAQPADARTEAQLQVNEQSPTLLEELQRGWRMSSWILR